MEIDLELFRREVLIVSDPPSCLSVIDISPDHPRRTLVFIHGFGGKALQWQYQLYRFSRSNRVIALDLRGHGRSDRPSGAYTMQVVQADLLALLDVLVPQGKIVLIGHSFGGAVAAEFAAAHPERVERLVLVATAGEYRLNPFYRGLLRLPYPLLHALNPLTRNWVGASPDVLKSWYDNNLCCWQGWDVFRRIALPTLVIRGHLDSVFQRPAYEEVTQTIPDAEEIDVGASGHLVMLERRDAVNRAISRFMDIDQRSWSQAQPGDENQQRDGLAAERPWLADYEPGVPYTLAIPPVPLQSLLDSAVRRFPTHTALIFEGKRLTYRRLDQEANRFANSLRWLGLNKGDRVILFMPNLPQMVISFYGTLRAGGVVVFTLPTTRPEELIRQIRDSGASILVTLTQSDELISQIKDKLAPAGSSPLRHIIFTHFGDYLPPLKRLAVLLDRTQHKRRLPDIPLDTSAHVFDHLLHEHTQNAPAVEVAPHDLAVIQYTGGTTASPKGVMLSHRNLVANALQTRHWMPEAQAGRERVLCVVPFSHSYGLTTALNMPIALGAALILKARFEVGDVLKAIQAYHPTIFPGVPQMYVAIQDYPAVRRFGIDSIKACLSGSAPLPVEVQESFEKLTRGRLVEGYGLTEASPVTHANPLNGERKVGSIGIPLPSTEARVVELTNRKRPVAVGQIGELAVRGPQVMLGYWQNEHATRRALDRDGWLLTGDVAEQDSQGYFRIIARKADMWYPAKPGKPAFPRDVEEVLFEVPQVKEAAVVAIAGQPIAFVIAKKERPSAESLIAYSKRRLPPELVPRLVIFLDDFPRTFIGKVLRRELADHFRQSHPELAGQVPSTAGEDHLHSGQSPSTAGEDHLHSGQSPSTAGEDHLRSG